MVCRDKEIQTILGCLITSRIKQESELLVIIDVEANTFPCISLVQVCVDTFSWCFYCAHPLQLQTHPCELMCLALQAGRNCSSFLFSNMGMTTSYTISTPQLLLFSPFPGKGSAKGPLPCVWGREGGSGGCAELSAVL